MGPPFFSFLGPSNLRGPLNLSYPPPHLYGAAANICPVSCVSAGSTERVAAVTPHCCSSRLKMWLSNCGGGEGREWRGLIKLRALGAKRRRYRCEASANQDLVRSAASSINPSSVLSRWRSRAGAHLTDATVVYTSTARRPTAGNLDSPRETLSTRQRRLIAAVTLSRFVLSLIFLFFPLLSGKNGDIL